MRLALVLIVSIPSGCSTPTASPSPTATAGPGSRTIPDTADLIRYTRQPHMVPSAFAADCRSPTPRETLVDLSPHSPFIPIDIYVNQTAYDALVASRRFPTGSVIVKQLSDSFDIRLFNPKDTTSDPLATSTSDDDKLIGAMTKMSPGYDPANGDWAYTIKRTDGSIDSGRIQACIDCHRNTSDYVFAFWKHEESTEQTNVLPTP